MFSYYHVDVFICLHCQKMKGMKKDMCREQGHNVPHCSCTGVPVKMGFIASMPKSTYLDRKRQANDNWMRFVRREPQGKNRKSRRLVPSAVRAAYDLGIA